MKGFGFSETSLVKKKKPKLTALAEMRRTKNIRTRTIQIKARTPFLAGTKLIDPRDRRKTKVRPVAVGKPTTIKVKKKTFKVFPVTVKF